ncbi:hypothetical protein QUA82_09945 [Microcoleus sp. F8-D3]
MWIPLGEVVPKFDLWLPFPDGANAEGATVFRAQFLSDGNIENVFSTLWLRRIWVAGILREKEVELSQKLYPQQHSVILWLPIPPDLEATGLIPAGYEVKKNPYRRGAVEPPWYVSLDVWAT